MSEKKLLYISAFTPFGKGESFVLQEACLVKELYGDFVIIPRNPPKEIFHEKAKDLAKDAIWLPLFSFSIAVHFLAALCSPKVWNILGGIIRHSRNIKVAFKNYLVLPKSLYVARLLKKQDVGHIHAHWASTTATMAYIISRMTGIPYSFTLHRWDIYENNMLKEKVGTAQFARCISEKGKEDLLSIVGPEFQEKVLVLHVGVELPARPHLDKPHEPFVVMTPANLIPVKGHRYLIEACENLKRKGINFRYWIVGDGFLEHELKRLVKDKGLEAWVSFLGRLPHEKVIQMYRNRLIDAVALPSISSDEGDMEGIPVALMEAMSYGVPVISTNTGAIPELIGDGSGLMVAEKDSVSLAAAIEKLTRDRALYAQLSAQGRAKVENEFNLSRIADELINLTNLRVREQVYGL